MRPFGRRNRSLATPPDLAFPLKDRRTKAGVLQERIERKRPQSHLGRTFSTFKLVPTIRRAIKTSTATATTSTTLTTTIYKTIINMSGKLTSNDRPRLRRTTQRAQTAHKTISGTLPKTVIVISEPTLLRTTHSSSNKASQCTNSFNSINATYCHLSVRNSIICKRLPIL